MIYPQISEQDEQRLRDISNISQNIELRFVAHAVLKILDAIETHNDYITEQTEYEYPEPEKD